MSSGGRSGRRPRRTWIRHVPESPSRSIGPRKRPWPRCSSPSCPVRCQLSRAARQASNGMSTIRRNDSQPTAEHASAPGPPSAQSADEGGGGGCQQFLASPASTLSQRRMLEMQLIGPLRHRLGSVQVAFDPPGRPGRAGTEHRRTPPAAVVCGETRRSGSRRGGEAPGVGHRSAPGSSIRGCRVLVSWLDPSDGDLFHGVRTGQERRNQGHLGELIWPVPVLKAVPGGSCRLHPLDRRQVELVVGHAQQRSGGRDEANGGEP